MKLTVASAWSSVPSAEPSVSVPTDSELVTELGTVDASFLHCQIGLDSSLLQDSIQIATLRPECSGIFQETWQHCQTNGKTE